MDFGPPPGGDFPGGGGPPPGGDFPGGGGPPPGGDFPGGGPPPIDGSPEIIETKCTFYTNTEALSCLYDAGSISKTKQVEELTNKILFTNSFTIWFVLILLLHRNWKRTMGYLIIAFYVCNVIYESSQQITFTFSNVLPPPQSFGGKLINIFYNIFYITYNLIGDWYPALRTKAIVKNKKSVRIVYATCILFNIAKIISFFYLFGNFRVNFDYYFIVVIASLIYDVSVLFVMRKNIFNSSNMRNSKMLQNNFLEKFKRTSEYRIYFSMIVSLMLLPIFVLYYIFRYVCKLDVDDNERGIAPFIQMYIQFSLSFNYYIMFMDQILLKFYVKKTEPTYKVSSSSYKGGSSYNGLSSYNGNPTSSFNHTPISSYQGMSNGMSTIHSMRNQPTSNNGFDSSYYFNNLSQNSQTTKSNQQWASKNFDEEMKFSYNLMNNAQPLRSMTSQSEHSIHFNTEEEDFLYRKYN